jgi:FkbH-like protein
LTDIEDLAGGLADICAAVSATGIDRETARASGDIAAMLEALRRNSPARLVAQGFPLPNQPVLGDLADANLAAGEGRAVASINSAMAQACRKIGDAVYFDQDHLAARYGREAWRDRRMFKASRLAVSPQFFRPYAEGLARAIRALYFPPRKVLCTDLDNTLWGGIVGEDGPDGVATGSAFPGNCYRDYQRYLKHLAARGVLLTIASKNNPADVQECFRMRAADLAVTLDDFVGVKIGWGEKSAALRELAQELSLGLDSFVFVDDNPVECAAIRQQLPGVLVVEAPQEQPWLLADAVAAAGPFDTLTITEDDRRRTEEYRAQARRSELETTAASREEFLASLGIECTILSALDAPLSRTAQLIAKSNQFNLTTRRHSAGDVERFSRRAGTLAVALRVRDRFGDAGVVGVALCATENGCCRIDTFLLSCRVIGRGVETALLSYLAGEAQKLGAKRLIGEYVPSPKNQLCEDFFPLHGFERATGDAIFGGVAYGSDLPKASLAVPPWIDLKIESPRTE